MYAQYEKMLPTQVASSAGTILVRQEGAYMRITIGDIGTARGVEDIIEDSSAVIPVMDNEWEFYWETGGGVPAIEKLTNPRFGSTKLDENLLLLGKDAPPIERIWDITGNLTSLSDLLSKERDDQ